MIDIVVSSEHESLKAKQEGGKGRKTYYSNVYLSIKRRRCPFFRSASTTAHLRHRYSIVVRREGSEEGRRACENECDEDSVQFIEEQNGLSWKTYTLINSKNKNHINHRFFFLIHQIE